MFGVASQRYLVNDRPLSTVEPNLDTTEVTILRQVFFE